MFPFGGYGIRAEEGRVQIESAENWHRPWVASARGLASLHPDWDAARIWLRVACLWDLDEDCELTGEDYEKLLNFTKMLGSAYTALAAEVIIPSTGDHYYLKLAVNDTETRTG